MTTPSICHLCVTHSPLVTRVFRATALKLGIPDDCIRTIARRGNRFCGRGLLLDDVSDELERCYRKLDRKGYHAARRRLEDALDEFTGRLAFEAYVPHANKILYQEIMSHRNCTGYSFLEEGFTSMAWNTIRNARSTPSKVFRTGLRTLWIRPQYRFKRPMFDRDAPNYRAAYAISGHAFKGMPGRSDVSAFLEPFREGSPPGNIYLILDAVHLLSGVTWDAYGDALVTAVARRSWPCAELFVKFHFADAEGPTRFGDLSRRLADHGLPRLQLLGPDFSVEENLTRSDLLVVATTALGYYSALAGARVECFAGEVAGLSLTSMIAKGRLPPDFREVLGISKR